jgi:addiction module RelE/StbE family toxin
MKYAFSKQCKKQLEKIKQKDQALYKKVKSKLRLFEQNPQHRSLRLHKLSGSQADAWSISIDMSLRMLFVYRTIEKSGVKEKWVIFYMVGTHKEVYK